MNQAMALGELQSGCNSIRLKPAYWFVRWATRARALCILTLFLAISCLSAHAAEDRPAAAATVKQQAQICGQAILHNDPEAFVSMLHPKAILALGGRNAVIKKLRQANQERKDQGSLIRSVTIGNVTQITQSKTEMFAVVPQTIETAARDGILRGESYLLGVSGDGGKTWRFIDSAEVAELGDQMHTLLPNLPADLRLPEPKDATVVPAHADAQAPQQESDQSDSVQLRRSFYTAKLPRGSSIGATNARTDPDHGALVTLPNGNPLAIFVVDDRTTLRETFNEILGSYRAKLNGTKISPSDLFAGRGGRGSIVSGTLIVAGSSQKTPYCFEAGVFRAETKGFILLCGYPQAQADENRQILRQVLDSLVVKE